MRLYVIGPITGHKDLNKPRFKKAKEILQKCGYDNVIIPHDVVKDPNTKYEVAMRISAITLLKCDGVAHLDCEASPGSTKELCLAMDYGLKVGRISDWVRAAKRRTDYADQAGLEYVCR